MKMERITKIVGVFIFIFLFLLTACFETASIPLRESDVFQTSNPDVEYSTQWMDELSKLKELTALQQKQLEELQEEIERLRNAVYSKADREQVQFEQDNISILRRLLLASDTVEVIEGFVQEVEEIDGQYIVQVEYAEWFSGEEAFKAIMEDQNLPREEVSVPNNFYIRRHTEDVRSFILSDQSLSFISKHASRVYLPREQLVDYLLDDDYKTYRMYRFYIVNGEITVIEERYIP